MAINISNVEWKHISKQSPYPFVDHIISDGKHVRIANVFMRGYEYMWYWEIGNKLFRFTEYPHWSIKPMDATAEDVQRFVNTAPFKRKKTQ